MSATTDLLHALALHKQRIRLLQEELCECPQRNLFQANLHDEACPVFLVGDRQASANRLARDYAGVEKETNQP